jgi:hypothetical protein
MADVQVDARDDDAGQVWLQQAVEGLVERDPALAGSTSTKWLFISEHTWPDGGGQTFSTFRSVDMPPWDALGLLRFATVQEEERSLYPPDQE